MDVLVDQVEQFVQLARNAPAANTVDPFRVTDNSSRLDTMMGNELFLQLQHLHSCPQSRPHDCALSDEERTYVVKHYLMPNLDVRTVYNVLYNVLSWDCQ